MADATFRAYTFPGGRRDAYLPAWIPVQIKPVDLSRVRSRQKVADKPMSTFHDTGNPRTNAAGEYSWLAAGRPGGVVGGYEWINDDKGIIVTGWFDEETWAQGDARGNRVSHAGELAFGGAVVWTTALEIACAMHGAVLEMEGSDPDLNAVLHQYWTQKWCSGQILNRKVWPVVKRKIANYAMLSAAARSGTRDPIDVPVNTYAPKMRPMVIGVPWDGRNDITINGVKFEAQPVTAKTTIPLNTRQWASSESLATGPTLPAGTEVSLLGWVAGELVDGVSEWWIGTGGSRLWAGGIDVQPKTDPDYGKKPEADPGLTVVNGRVYFDLNSDEDTGEPGRTITIHRNGDLHRWADSTSTKTGTLKAGQKVTCHYWTRGEELPLKLPSGETVGEMIWYVQGDDLNAGNRFWSGLSTERPD